MPASPDDQAQLLQAALRSDYFSAPGAVDDVAAYLSNGAAAATELGGRNRDVERVVLVGSGGSLACLHTAKYILERLSARPVDVVPALELRWRKPLGLGAETLVVFNSWSGKNADVLDALDYAASRGARTAAIVAKSESPLSSRCDSRVLYSGRSIYEVPILAVVDLVLGMDEIGAHSAWRDEVAELPAALDAANARSRAVAPEQAAEWADSEFVYVLGAGPFSSLALKLANVLMENDRIGAAYYDAAEFRHGAVEAFERIQPDVLILTGSDESRPLTDRVASFCREHAGRVLEIDASSFGLRQPMLEPLVANVMTQWFVVHSAFERGIRDLDDRVFMGGQTLSSGQWP